MRAAEMSKAVALASLSTSSAAAVVLGALAGALAFAQGRPPEAGTGLIVGHVVDGRTGRPVSGATVAIGGVRQPRILTGSTGAFVFRDLPRGTFTITATKRGYAAGAYGRRRPQGPAQALALAPDERIGELSIPIWKHAAIGGTVVDETSEPVVRVQVRAWRRTIVAGERRVVPAGTTLTDDRGAYRLGELVPGEYIVAASARHVVVPSTVDTREWGPAALQARDLVYMLGRGTVTPPPPDARFSLYPATYFAGSRDALNAMLVAVSAGEERLSVDMQVHPVETARVSGVLTSPDDLVAFQSVRLVPEAGLGTGEQEEAEVVATDARGAFVFPAVVPGRYTLRSVTSAVSSMNPSAGMVWGDLPLQVGATDIDGVTVALRPALHISGRVQFEGKRQSPSPAQVRRIPLVIEPADGGVLATNRIQVGDDGEFTSPGLVGGRYLLRVSDSPEGWMFKSATLGGRDISTTPVDLGFDASGVVITFTDRWSGLNGVVQNRSRNPDPDALVVMFPADRGLWSAYGRTSRLVRGVRTGRYGDYSLESVPPGDYLLAAVPDDKADDWQDPEVLGALARSAVRVRLGDGEKRRLDLRTQEIR